MISPDQMPTGMTAWECRRYIKLHYPEFIRTSRIYFIVKLMRRIIFTWLLFGPALAFLLSMIVLWLEGDIKHELSVIREAMINIYLISSLFSMGAAMTIRSWETPLNRLVEKYLIAQHVRQ